MRPLSVMTYNIKCDWPGNRERTWDDRGRGVLDRIAAFQPDVLGVQEAFRHQWEDVARALPGHHMIAVGRDDGRDSGEATALFLDRHVVPVVSHDTFWISPTPRSAGSLWPGAGCPRTVTWAIVRYGGDDVLIVNTHLDHVSAEARRAGAQAVAELVAEHRLPSIVMGDFNCLRSDEPVQILQGNRLPALPSDGLGTFNDWNPAGPHDEIDYVFTTSHWTGEATVDRVLEVGGPPSDHWPVSARLTLSALS